MGDPVWGDMLIALRRIQLQRLQSFRNQAIERRLNLVWEHRKERLMCTHPLELAKLVCYQTQQLIELQQQKQHSYEALKREHAAEVYGLLQFKLNNF